MLVDLIISAFCGWFMTGGMLCYMSGDNKRAFAWWGRGVLCVSVYFVAKRLGIM